MVIWAVTLMSTASSIKREFSTLENIFCAFLAENIFVKVLIQDL